MSNEKNIVSGGFATMNPDSTLNINAVEAFPVEDFSAEVNHRFFRKHTR